MKAARQTKNLEKIIRLATEVLKEVQSSGETAQKAEPRKRRSGKELAAFRKMLKAERKKGANVAELAKQHGISTAYIYTLG